MPLEIRELIIKVDIRDTSQAQIADMEQYLEELTDKVVEKCLEQVFSKLENFFER